MRFVFCYQADTGDGGIYTYVYDAAGRLTCTTTPLDYQVEITYDKVNNLIKEADRKGMLRLR